MALKRLALITENPRKAEEWALHLKPQGVTCERIAPDSCSLEEQLEQLRGGREFAVICREQSRLVRPGSQDDVALEHLALVDHLCTIQVWYLEEDHWGTRTFEARRAGYLDTSGPLEAGGWWDACFRDARTGLSYLEQALQKGRKLSARGAALDSMMDFFAPQKRQARHLGLTFEAQVVDLDRSVRTDVLSNPCFATLPGSFLGDLVESALRQGLFTSVGRTRSQQVYFWPGLSGLPSVPRESAVDEAKFLFHDLIHFLIGRLVPCGRMTEHERRVFVSWAMVEEAVALMLADGYFVDYLNSHGIEYDFHQHKGYPFFCAMGLAGQPVEMERLREVLWANVAFFVLGNPSEFSRLGLDSEDPRARAYLDGFDRFAMGDWLWNERMALHARADEEFYERWWSLAEPVNRRANLRIMTAREAGSLVAGGNPEELVRGVFEVIMERRLLARPPAEESPDKARWRWLVGQLGYFAALGPESGAVERAGKLLSQAEDFIPVPDFLRQSMAVAVEAGLCTAHQAGWWADFYPLFPPYYISYKARPGLSVSGLAQRILSEDGGARLLENELGVVAAIICDEGRQRFLLERKVGHPNPLCDGRHSLVGGFRQHPGESSAVAWRREAGEEWCDPVSHQVAQKMADRAVPWRRFRFQGVEFPGDWDLEVMLIELPGEQFDQFTRVLVEANAAATRPEGWPEVHSREKLAELPFLSGHEQVLEEFLGLGF